MPSADSVDFYNVCFISLGPLWDVLSLVVHVVGLNWRLNVGMAETMMTTGFGHGAMAIC